MSREIAGDIIEDTHNVSEEYMEDRADSGVIREETDALKHIDKDLLLLSVFHLFPVSQLRPVTRKIRRQFNYCDFRKVENNFFKNNEAK